MAAAFIAAAASAASAATNDFSFRSIASEFANYDTLRATEAVAGGVTASHGLVCTTGATDDLIYSFVGPQVATTSFAAGTWTMNLWAEADQNNVGFETVKVYVFARTVLGAENLLFTSSYGTALAGAGPENDVWTFVSGSARAVNPTDRLVVKVYAAQSTGGGKTAGDIVTFYYDSTTRPSKVTSPFDITAPNPVNNLGAATMGVGTARLTWTAPGNDGVLKNLLAGSRYLVQYSTYVASWSTAAAQVSIATSAVAPAAAQYYDVGGLVGGTSYYFALWTQDESANYSAVSSTASAAAGRPPTPGVLAPSLTGVWITSAAAQWTNGGNPGGTVYNLDASTAADFSGTLFSSSTLNTSAFLTGLPPGTSYALRVDAVVGFSSSVYLALGSTVTMPAPPGLFAPAFTMVGVSSATAQWSDGGNPAQSQFNLQASTAANFSGTLFSSATYNLAATLAGLSGRTTYYFRVNVSTNGRTGGFSALGSTTTLVAAPTVAAPTFTGVFTISAAAQWGSGGNGAGTQYNLQASTASDFSGTLFSSGTANASATVPGLSTSTLYFFQVDAVVTGSSSVFTALGSTPTLPAPPLSLASTFTMVGISSATAQWAVNANGPAASYDLQASSAANFTGTLFSSTTASPLATLTGLAGATTYYFQVRARTASGATAFTGLGSTLTSNNPAVPPGALAPAFTMVAASSASAQWTSGGNPAGTLYTLQASTAGDFSGTLFSSATYNLFATATGLSGDTTHYFQVKATVNGGDAYLALGSTITRPGIPAAATPAFTFVGVSSVTAQWASGGNSTATVYALDASTAADFSGVLVTSSTPGLFAATAGLTLNSTYYFRVRASGNGYASPFLTLGSTITYPAAPALAPPTYTAVDAANVTAQWSANGNGGGVSYALQASTAADFSGTLFSSATLNLSAVISSLSGFTTYYFQVNASTNGNTSAFAALGSTMTRPAPPGAPGSPFAAVYVTSVTAQWTSGGNGPGTRYTVQASTASDFSGTLFSSNTAALSAALTGLAANTPYFFQVRAEGGGFFGAFTVLGSTRTRVFPPGAIASAFTMVGISSATANWSNGGNAAGTTYTLSASTAADQSGIVFTSATLNTSATLINLFSQTTYYFQVTATAAGFNSDATILGSTVTLPPAQSAGNLFYFRQIPSDISGYDVARATETPTAAVDSVRSVATSGASDDLIYSYASPAVGTGTLAGGTWSFNLYGNENNTGSTANATFKVVVYIRSGLSESLYFSSLYGPQLAVANSLYTWSAAVGARAVSPTDKLVVKVYAASASGLTKQAANSVDFHLDSTGSSARFGMPFDIVAPSSVTTLAATTGAAQGTIQLNWNAPGNDASFKNLLIGSQFRIEYSTYGVNWSSVDAQILIATGNVLPGAVQGYTLGGLVGGSTYFFRLWTVDESLNVGDLSNAATAMAQVPPTPGLVPPAFLSVGASSVTAQW